ncbi:MAG: hypothetical protein LBR60_09370 [Fibrobacter sp.]|jgi:hypothetical protein|nr:hypothetical protein [Fibrobacter sp.]
MRILSRLALLNASLVFMILLSGISLALLYFPAASDLISGWIHPEIVAKLLYFFP